MLTPTELRKIPCVTAADFAELAALSELAEVYNDTARSA